MGFYPVFLELAGRHVLVVGGGLVAERRVHGLLAADATVTVVSPALTPALAALASGGRLRHHRRGFEPGDLDGVDLAFAATDRGEVNAALFVAACARGVWVNAADDPAHCTFILPAVVRRGGLSVAVSTGGTSPALARAIREELERYLTAEYATLAEIAAAARRRPRAPAPRRRRRLRPPGGSASPRRGATGAPGLRGQGERRSRAAPRADQRPPREARAARPARRAAQGRRPLRLRPGRRGGSRAGARADPVRGRAGGDLRRRGARVRRDPADPPRRRLLVRRRHRAPLRVGGRAPGRLGAARDRGGHARRADGPRAAARARG